MLCLYGLCHFLILLSLLGIFVPSASFFVIKHHRNHLGFSLLSETHSHTVCKENAGIFQLKPYLLVYGDKKFARILMQSGVWLQEVILALQGYTMKWMAQGVLAHRKQIGWVSTNNAKILIAVSSKLDLE